MRKEKKQRDAKYCQEEKFLREAKHKNRDYKIRKKQKKIDHNNQSHESDLKTH